MLFPDIAVVVAVVTLFYCLFLFEGTRKLFRDSDTGWHIRTGESIWSAMSLPRNDPYSFSRPGEPWLAWEWVADALMGAAHRVDGLPGVALLYACAIALCTWLWFRLTWVVGGDFLLACLMAVPMLSTANLHWLARPHVFGWVFALAALWYVESGRRSLVAAALFSAVWANFHASFLLAPLIALSRTGPAEGNCEGVVLHRQGGLTTRPQDAILPHPACRISRLWGGLLTCAPVGNRRSALLALASLAGTLANPYGWNLHRHVFAYLSDSELLQRIGEFQSFNFHAPGAGQILLAAGIAFAGGVLALTQGRWGHFFLATLLVAGALRSARGLPLAALLALPLANGAITRALAAAGKPRLDNILAYSARLRTLDSGLSGLVWTPVAVALAFVMLRAPAVRANTGFPPDQFPVEAASAVEKLPAGARLLAPDKFGGYLIYRFSGQRKVFFDGRSDYYGVAFMKDYIRLIEVRPGWRDQIERWNFTHALLPVNYSLADALENAGWRAIHRDRTAVLLERL